jgi:branched-chain amino acid transport system permease protein
LVALATIVASAQLMLFGPDAKSVQVDYQLDSFELGKILVDKARLYAAACAVAIALLQLFFFRFTLTGKAIRACADNYLGAQIVGLNVKRLYALSFGLGTASVAVAGSSLTLLMEVTPSLGPTSTLLAFVIVIVGGLGSMVGALLGGVLIGLSEALAGLFVAPSLKSMFSFALLILVLLLRPQGLLGRRP